ncbi:MAG: hypothetical protein D8M57_15180 [Candidatus Scalindua sp. AMX11]|nr:MAG: hypothetical protein DWQ00_02470 [Candidatus Scalindua sp.]NOG83994.1 hypothetical protein [Planctomycetota bacterium]RZV88062.1 MAG: hypothetical protein EX341_07065 [Candidatus Scalindua sp. SCAELEC01]TDE63995.1 MAG: hypothetical protein D8M57_15180 [Candidatus Scalindua sp. AMX11]GJQ60528.1 MAG: hypothetical protein SCALA701_33290 [Candidatus Scalindua sp.]
MNNEIGGYFCEVLRLVEEREAKLKALRKYISTAIERGGNYSDYEIGEALANDRGKEEKSTKKF